MEQVLQCVISRSTLECCEWTLVGKDRSSQFAGSVTLKRPRSQPSLEASLFYLHFDWAEHSILYLTHTFEHCLLFVLQAFYIRISMFNVQFFSVMRYNLCHQLDQYVCEVFGSALVWSWCWKTSSLSQVLSRSSYPKLWLDVLSWFGHNLPHWARCWCF